MIIFDSFAYLDFGTGTVIVQAIVGAVAGVALFGRRMVTAVKQKLGLIKLDEDDDIVEVRPTESKKDAAQAEPKKPTRSTTTKKTTKKGGAKKSAKKSGRK